MNYIDGCVTPVAKKDRAAFAAHAAEFAAIFKEYGALSVVDCWGDDVPEGKLTSFPMAVKLQDDEVAVFSWIGWESKAARDSAWEKLMAHPRMQPGAANMPFDGKRMIFGGFSVLSNV